MQNPSASDSNTPVDITHLLDYEQLRAQMLNCLLMANGLFQKHNEGLTSSLVFGRITDLGVLFTLFSNASEPRLYLFRLLNPDGTQAHLARLNERSESLDLEPFDQGFIGAISSSLGSTVAAAYHQMVREPVAPTHPGVNIVH